MINLRDGELLDILPSSLKNDTDMICLSHALKVGINSLLNYAVGAMTQNYIDQLPEKVLDILAVELRAPYYLQDMDIEVKRNIIKNALIWHTKAGTSAAVAEMIGIIFGEGEVVEWYDFTEGEKIPGTFDIVTNARLTEDIIDYFAQIIERVKNERSHLRRVLIERDIDVASYIKAGAFSVPHWIIVNIPDEGFADLNINASIHTGAGHVFYPGLVITNHFDRETSTSAKAHGGVGLASSAHFTIPNRPRDEPS